MKKLVLKKTTDKKNYQIDYKKELNDSQYEAVMHQKGAALVIAGAGTGKTRTVVYRVARLIEEGTDPQSILLLTFTRKAAEEMKRRAANLLDGRCNKIISGTYHSFALNILRKYSQELSFGKFNIIDQSDAEDTISLIRTNYLSKKNFKTKRFPQKSVIAKIISMSINKQESIQYIIENEYPYFINEIHDIENIHREYQIFKKNSNILDYDDLLLNLHNILKTKANIRKSIIESIKYIMVDEYQDSNRLQHEIVLMLANQDSNIMVVGDDAQSIYSFRGAEYQNILFFPKSFSDCKIYKIEENYRSTTPILNFTNDVINNSNFSYKKNLYSSKTEGEKPIVLSTKNERQQSLFIVQHLLEERENGLNLNDVAILFRSNFHSFDLEIELNKANIPYKKYGGLKFIESAHVKDLLAYLRIIYNEKDMVSLNRVLRLIKGVGNATINRISEEYSKENSNIVEMLNSAKNLKSKDDLIILFGLISEFRNKYQDKLEILISKIIDYYTPYLTENYENDNKRLQDLDTIKQIAERYSNLEGFLNDLSIDPAIASVEDIEGESKEDEFITLSTIHSAKGLEWKTVILIWALDGKFPSSKAADKTESLEEERRLFYVATTRAKDNLYITYPTNIYDTESGFVLSKHCRFIDDASDDSYDTYTLVEEE